MRCHRLGQRFTAVAVGVATALAGLGGFAEAAEPNWLTGAALQRRLAEPTDILWSGQALRPALENLARAQQVAILLDRRVDPGRPVDLAIHHVPLSSALEQIARRQDLGLTLLGPVVYFGPVETAKQLRTLAALRAEAARKLPPELTRRLLQSKPLRWPELAEPRTLVEQLAQECGLKLEGLDRVPHDLWAAAETPPLPLTDRLTLVAGQFDLTFAVDAASGVLTLQPWPAEVALVRSYDGGANAGALARRFAELAPEAQIKVVGEKVWVKGRWEDHEAVAGKRPEPAAAKGGPKTEAFANTRYTLTVVEQPLGTVLKQLAAQMQLDLRIDEAALRRAGIALDQRVSFSVKQATVDELFTAALRTTSLSFRRDGAVLEIRPAK